MTLVELQTARHSAPAKLLVPIYHQRVAMQVAQYHSVDDMGKYIDNLEGNEIKLMTL